MHETSSNALLIHFHSAPFALYNAPPSTLGSREPLGWTCRTVKSWTPWWTSPMPEGGHRSTPMEAHVRGRARPSPLVAGRPPRLARQRTGNSSSPALAGDAGMPRRCVSHRCDRAFCRGDNFSECQGQLGFGSHLGSIDNRLFLYTFGIIVGDTHKYPVPSSRGTIAANVAT